MRNILIKTDEYFSKQPFFKNQNLKNQNLKPQIMKHLTILCTLVVTLFSCKQSMHDTQNEIVLDDFIEKPMEMDLNEIASNVDYIQLENTPKSLFGTANKIEIRNGKIYVMDEDNSLLLVFDTSGKFIRKIGNRGQGPGEYVGIRDFALSDSVILIHDQMQTKMILYDTSGRLIVEKRMDVHPTKLAFLNGMPICEYNFPDFVYNQGYRILIFDRTLNLFASLLKSDIEMDEATAEDFWGHSRSFFAFVEDTLTFWECREDIVYRIINENEVVKKYQIRYENPLKFEDGMATFKEGNSEVGGIMETRNCLFLTGFYKKGDYCRWVYFKKSGKGINVEEGFKYKGQNFFPDGVTEDGKLYSSFSVYAYKTKLEKNGTLLEQVDPKLQSLLQTCKFDDNLCIMLVTLK